MDRWPEWARWLAVVPAAFAGALLARFVITQTLGGLSGDGGSRSVDPNAVQFLQQVFGPMATLWAGATVAPRHKTATAIVLGVAFFALATLVVLSADRRWDPIGLLMNVVGVVAGIFIARTLDRKVPR
jgi:hypothetical protein